MGVLAVNTNLRRTAGWVPTVMLRGRRGARNAARAAFHSMIKDRLTRPL
jgi:hypothetical protein